MNQGQEKFYNFILDRVKDEDKTDAKNLLDESFAKQAAGTFTRQDMLNAQQVFLKMLKPEAVGEVVAAMAQFASQMK
jgi:hypothetical protein